MDNDIVIGIYTIRHQDIPDLDLNRRRWFVYKLDKLYGRFENKKQAIKSTKI